MIKNHDIVVVGIQSWDLPIGSNCKNIAEEFSKHNRVLYVNPPLDRGSVLKGKNNPLIKKQQRVRKGFDPDLVQIKENLWNLYPKTIVESINWIKNPRLFDMLNKRNAKKFASDVSSAIKKLGVKNFILFNDSSMHLGVHLDELLNPVIHIYYMRDYLIKNHYWKIHGVRIEPQLIKKVDLVVNNSVFYTEYGAKYNKHSYMIGQGCDTSLFNDNDNKIAIPEDMKSIPGPILGYVGVITSKRLSIEILTHIAKTKPEWSIVLVGPEDDKFKSSELHQFKNVFFPGSRDTSELPAYIKSFDIAMNPQIVNFGTIGNYPRKIDEYLTMGKPVIATSTKAMEYFKDYTYLGDTKEDYIKIAEKALKEDSPDLQKKRKLFGTSHSWSNNVQEIYKYIELIAREKEITI